MAKLDKSLYTKDAWRAVKHQRAQDKARLRAMKTGQPMPAPTPTPTPPIVTRTQIRPPLEGNIAFVLGNGISRKGIKLDHLREWGKIYGCNALYREYAPDYLIAVDAKMITEICESNWQLHNTVWTNPNKNMEKYKGLNFFKPSQGWSSGPTALWLSTHHGHKTLYILGFDYVGTQEGKLNNLYGSTRNYRKNTDPATYHGNWLRQTTIVIQKNPKNQYIRVVQDDRQGFQAEELRRFSNYSEMSVSDFRSAFCRPRPVQN
jgi:hypothetical protein